MDQPLTEKPKRNGFDYLKLAIDVATYPLAAAAAFYVGRTSLRGSVYKSLARSGVFKDAQNELHANYRSAMLAPPGNDAPKQIDGFNEIYRERVRNIIEGHGFKHPWHYFQALSDLQRINALVFAAGTAGVVVTTLLTVSNSKALIERTSRAKYERDQEALAR